MYARSACRVFRYRSHLITLGVGQAACSSVPLQNTVNMNWFRQFTSRQTHTSSTPIPTRSHINPTLSQGILISDCDEDSIYHYTSGRWLWNEKEQLSRRYVKFNLAELVQIATHATGSKSFVEVQKLPEGNFCKVLLLKTEDGKEVIAKLPNPNAGSQYFTTASEVATMDYVRIS